MQEITQEQIDVLVSLQEIVSESNRIKKIIDSVEEKKKTLNEKLDHFREEIQKQSSELQTMKERYQIFESEFNERADRIGKSRETIKTVSSHKEYQVLSREIDDNVNQNKKIEEVMIHDLELIESEEKDLKENQAALAQLESQTQEEVQRIEDEFTEEKQQLEVINRRKEEITPLVMPKLLVRFNKILNTAGGIAVVPVENGTCRGCNINIPPQKNIELQRGGTLNFCMQCHRIIYYKAPEEVKEEGEE